MPDESALIPVRVALRCRPLIYKETADGCQECLQFVPDDPQVIIGSNKAFTYDYTFPPYASQEEVYSLSVARLIETLFKGYNVTVLAYGQTGSGKTYTMGTTFYHQCNDDVNMGIIPRALKDVFEYIEQHKENEFLVKVSFLEIHKEEIFDLLSRNKEVMTIREHADGRIRVVGLSEMPVKTPAETFQMLERGSLSRTTASTAMNSRSSRSHAIFTLSLEMKSDGTDTINAKLHLVDLAGSERAKKTCAQGERFKEGVKINSGLLALGNVISALCTESGHIPYRDSKLTRLLQDSLGGNSHTIMMACVSPADSSLEETLNTLRYADRARKIKNKPIVNRDPQASELIRLRQLVQQLQIQLLQNRIIGGTVSDSQGNEEDLTNLLERIKFLENENRQLTHELRNALNKTTAFCEKSILAEMARERMQLKLEELKEKSEVTLQALNQSLDTGKSAHFQDQLSLVKELQERIAEIQSEQLKKAHELSLYSPVKNQSQVSTDASGNDSGSLDGSENQEDEENYCDDIQRETTWRQVAMNKELEELDKHLALKEDLANQMKANEAHITTMKMQYENVLKQLEDEVSNLQKERDDLSLALKSAKQNPTTMKISEQRRKKLQQLETQIACLKKEIAEKARMLKMKDEAEKKVKALQQEITNMKQARVKLLRQMRSEADRNRQLRMEKDREMAKLRQQDRKRQVELVNKEKLYGKQTNVLRRKVEEALAVNKRLQEALQMQKAAAERREKKETSRGATARIQNWLSHELEVVVTSREAQHHLESLLEDRKATSGNLNRLCEQLDCLEPPRKRFSGNENEEACAEEQELKQRIQEVEMELQMLNAQISDLQQQILDADHVKDKHRWDSIQGLSDAKCALNWLFEAASSTKVEKLLKDIQCKDLQSKRTELRKAIDKLREQHSKETVLHREEQVAMQREHEDKTFFLLQQIQRISNTAMDPLDLESSLQERIKFQEEELAQFQHLHEELQEKTEECKLLRKQLETKKRRSSIVAKPSFITKTPKVPRKTRTGKARPRLPVDIFMSSPSSQEDDNDADPDWRMTPHMRHTRLAMGKSKKSQMRSANASNLNVVKPSKSVLALNTTVNKSRSSGESVPAEETEEFKEPGLKESFIVPQGGILLKKKRLYKPDNSSFFSPVHPR